MPFSGVPPRGGAPVPGRRQSPQEEDMRLQTAKREGRLALMCRHYQIYLLLLPTLTYFLLFKYAPM